MIISSGGAHGKRIWTHHCTPNSLTVVLNEFHNGHLSHPHRHVPHGLSRERLDPRVAAILEQVAEARAIMRTVVQPIFENVVGPLRDAIRSEDRVPGARDPRREGRRGTAHGNCVAWRVAVAISPVQK